MSRGSIFDPEGEQTEHSGSRYTGPRADNVSHMPPDVVDGKVNPEEAADLEELAAEEDVERQRDEESLKNDPDIEP
jgi:hypothetical protein